MEGECIPVERLDRPASANFLGITSPDMLGSSFIDSLEASAASLTIGSLYLLASSPQPLSGKTAYICLCIYISVEFCPRDINNVILKKTFCSL